MSALPIVRRTPKNLSHLVEDIDRLADLDAWYGFPPSLTIHEMLWHPTMDMYNRKDNIVVELEIPGIKEEDIDISIEQDHLIVKGSRKQSSEHKEGDQFYTERSYGEFHRVIHLPTSVDEDKVTANLKEGLLTVTMPKKKKETGKKIKLESK
jgi:HSP20 family protein